VDHDGHAIECQPYVEFDSIRANGEGLIESGKRILGRNAGCATMSDDQRPVCSGGDDL
jgi:hypothetical protein